MSLPTRPCRHCHRPIALVLTVAQRRMPIDPQPDPTGNVYLAYVDGMLVATVARKDAPVPDGVAYRSHFTTCPALTRRRKPDRPVVEQPALDLT